MDLNGMAADFLAALAEQREVPGGLLWTRALQQAQLDGSEASIARLDRLLDQIRVKLHPRREEFLAEPAKMNFALLLAFYLGGYVANRASVELDWLGFDEGIKAGIHVRSADRFDAAVTAVFGNGPVRLPCKFLDVIGERLFVDAPAITLAKTVELRLEDVEARELGSQSSADENAVSQEYLRRFFSGEELPGGLAWRKELLALGLDYSLHSLHAVDRLLAEIRIRDKPDFDSFVSHRDTLNFALLLGYYLCSTAARAGSMSMKWLGREEVLALRKGEPMNVIFTRACRLGDFAYYPLATVGERLLGNRDRSLHADAQHLVKENTQTFFSVRKPRLPAAQANRGDAAGGLGRLFGNSGGKGGVDPIWAKAMTQAGFFAAMEMSMVQGGQHPAAVLVPTADGKHSIHEMGMFGGEDTPQRLAQMLQHNPERAAYLVGVIDAYANLPTGRIDALQLDVRSYGGNKLQVQMLLPYRSAEHPKGFAIHSPKVTFCSAAKPLHGLLFDAFYQGTETYKLQLPGSEAFSWIRYLDESV